MLNKFINPGYLIIAVLLLTFLQGCKKDELPTGQGSLRFEFEPFANGDKLVFGNKYLNAAGEEMTFNRFDYFISNIELIRADGSTYTVPKDSSYFLIQSRSGTSSEIRLNNIPAADYTGFRFLIGVDSAKSVAPLNERKGVLDPGANDMYWAWNSGYIFVKVEGTSPAAPLDSVSNTHRFRYHIGLFGGYNSPTLNNLKKVTINSDVPATLRSNLTPLVHLKVDVMEMFKTPEQVSVAQNPTVMVMPYSRVIANNYADMFKLEHIHN